MKHEEVLNFLENESKKNGINIRYEKGDFDGGFCILRDEQVIVINRKLSDLRKLLILSDAMSKFGFDKIEYPLEIQLILNKEEEKVK
ncbi:MAG: hypothetical protein AAB255_01695 [Bacteroidota bacterium]